MRGYTDFSLSSLEYPPVIIEFAGGLGNQLFQYCFAQYLRHHPLFRKGRAILFDCTAVYRDLKRHLHISEFNIDKKNLIHSKKILFSLLGTRINNSLSTWEKMINRIVPYTDPAEAKSFFLIDDSECATMLLSSTSMEDYVQHVLSLIDANSTVPIYIRGYWQYCYFYLHTYAHMITPPVFEGDLSSTILTSIFAMHSRPSCSLHIRRGDYLLHSVQTSLPPLDMEYYNRAIEVVLTQYPDCRFYVFSDDPEWCTTHLLHLLTGVDRKLLEIVSRNVSTSTVEDIILMNQCSHHILANSSFSWWGAVLPDIVSNKRVEAVETTGAATVKDSKDSLTIAPNRWFAEELLNVQICPVNWKRI